MRKKPAMGLKIAPGKFTRLVWFAPYCPDFLTGCTRIAVGFAALGLNFVRISAALSVPLIDIKTRNLQNTANKEAANRAFFQPLVR
jgi:hypothetical protein